MEQTNPPTAKQKRQSIIRTRKQKEAMKKANSEKQNSSTASELGSRDTGLNVESEVTFTPTVNGASPPPVETPANGEAVNVNTPPVRDQSDIVTNDEQTLNRNDQTNTPAENNDAVVVSDTEIEEMYEVRFAEKIHHQTERLFDLIEDLERVNKTEWIESKDQEEALGKLRMICEKINRVRRNTIDLPEFLERRPMRDQPDYQYILRAINAFKDVQAQIEIAKNFVFNLPGIPDLASGDNKKKGPGPVTPSTSTSSLLEEAKQGLKAKMQRDSNRRTQNRGSTAEENVQQIYGDARGQAVNDLLNKQVPPTNNKQRPNPKVRILPKGAQEEDFLRPRPPSKNPTLWEEGSSDDGIPFDQASLISEVSLPPRNPRPPRYKKYKNYDFGFSRRNKNPLPPPDDDWIEVKTKMNPQSGKPRHYGKILSFRNLFMNSFQLHMVYNPDKVGCIQTTNSTSIKTVPFDGEDLSLFREFEQNILMRAVNNVTEGWDAKFTTLLTSTTGPAKHGVQGYSGNYTMQNFVQALESLYYSYGKPSQYRNSLLNQLTNDEYVDLKKPASLQKTNMIILKLLNEFNLKDNEAYDWVWNSVRMSEEAKVSFKLYCVARGNDRNLQSLSDWMWLAYNDLVESSSKSAKVGRSSKAPVLMKMLSGQSEEEMSSTNEEEVSEEGIVAFAKTNPVQPRRNFNQKSGNFRVTNVKANYPDGGRCDLCFDEKHNYCNCRVFAFLSPDQRKLWLLTRNGCYTCTEIGHSSSTCTSERKCLTCQSTKHHEMICEAVGNSWEATRTRKWNKNQPKETSEKVKHEEPRNEPTKPVHFLEEEKERQ